MSAGPPIVDDGSNEDPSSGYYDVENKFSRWRKSADAHWSQWRQSAREVSDLLAVLNLCARHRVDGRVRKVEHHRKAVVIL